MRTIMLPVLGIVVTLNDDGTGGSITSNLKEACPFCGGKECLTAYNACIDGIEAMILGHAIAGVDIASPAYLEGLQTALDAASNHFGG